MDDTQPLVAEPESVDSFWSPGFVIRTRDSRVGGAVSRIIGIRDTRDGFPVAVDFHLGLFTLVTDKLDLYGVCYRGVEFDDEFGPVTAAHRDLVASEVEAGGL